MGIAAKTHNDFAEVRRRLLSEGFDCVVTDGCIDEESGIWVVLDPARIRIVGEMSLENAVESVDTDVSEGYAHVKMSGGEFFEESDIAEAPAI